MMRKTSSALTTITLVLGLCFPFPLGRTAPAVDAIAQIQIILVNDAPADLPTIEQIQIKRANGTTEPGRAGMQLFKDDEVTTGTGVKASLLFDKADSEDQVQVQIHESSRARIGSFWAHVGRFLISGWGTFDTSTQEVRLGKRNTEFYVEVGEDNSVDVKVLRGGVDVEPVAGNQAPAENSHARAVFQKRILSALQGVKIEKGQPPPEARPLKTTEVESVLTKTDKLMVASLAATTPSNVVPTSFQVSPEILSDVQRKKAAIESAFIAARRAATLSPIGDNISALAHAYKDLGAGKRGAKEYELAEQLKPELKDSVTFLAGQAEAYRLAGNLKKADDKSKEAVAKSQTPKATPFEKQLALNTRGNLKYDLAVQYIGEGQGGKAYYSFEESKSLLLAVKPDDELYVITDSNLKNTLLALNREDKTIIDPTLKTVMNSTYRGVVSFRGGKLPVPAILVISGSRFSLITCNGTLNANIVSLRPGPPLSFDLIPDGSIPVKTVSMIATLPDRDRIELTSAPSEVYGFSFSTSPKQEPLNCRRIPISR